MPNNNLELGMRCIKYMLLCITAMFVITSALVISVGTTIYALYYNVALFLDSHFFSPATLLVVIGVLMLFVSLFGCIGALKESTCLVNIFAVTLTMVLILEIAVAIAAYSLRPQVTQMLSENVRETLPMYQEDMDAQKSFDFIQSRMNCCGVDSYKDWADVDLSNVSSGIKLENMTVPFSCCADAKLMDDNTRECYTLYANGCLPRVTFLIYQSAGLLGAGAMTIAFIQIIGIIFSFTLASAIRKTKSERERRRWEIQERMINAYASLNPNDEKRKSIVYVPFQGQTNA